MQPDPPLSPAARDVLHELEAFARVHPEASAGGHRVALARQWIPGKLKRRWRR